jgi:hypothetical protein
MCAGGLLLACGARVSEHAASVTADGTGGAETSMPTGGARGLGPSPTSPGTGGGGATSIVAGDGGGGLVLGEGIGSSVGGAVPDGGTSCTYAHPECNTFDSYVDLVEDGIPFRLSYPADPGCGRCVAGRCDLYGNVGAGCGIYIRVSACAGPDGSPPCLDTASGSAPYYIDRSGTRWDAASLSATSLPGNVDSSTSVVDVQASLTFAHGAQQPTLPAHVHLCASVTRLLLPC